MMGMEMIQLPLLSRGNKKPTEGKTMKKLKPKRNLNPPVGKKYLDLNEAKIIPTKVRFFHFKKQLQFLHALQLN